MTFQQRLEPGRYLLDVDAYALLGASGSFGDAKTELIAGEIFVTGPEYAPHLRVKSELAYRLRQALEAIGNLLFVGIDGSVRVSAHDMPEPDILLTSAIQTEGPVLVASVALIVEVSSSTLDYDLDDKAGLRGRRRAGILGGRHRWSRHPTDVVSGRGLVPASVRSRLGRGGRRHDAGGRVRADRRPVAQRGGSTVSHLPARQVSTV